MSKNKPVKSSIPVGLPQSKLATSRDSINERLTPIRAMVIFWLPVVSFMILIFIGSGLNGIRLHRLLGGPSMILSVLHAIEFGLLAILIYRVLHVYLKWRFLYLSLVCFSLTVGYGVIDELRQSLAPFRDSNPFDVLANGIGAGLALSGLWGFERLKRLSTELRIVDSDVE